MSFEIQSKLAIMSFSLRVSQASRRGSKISRGRSPPRPSFTISSARCVLSRRGAERLASLEAAIVSSAEEMSTAETVWPFAAVRVRLCESVEGLEETDDRPPKPSPLRCGRRVGVSGRTAWPLLLAGKLSCPLSGERGWAALSGRFFGGVAGGVVLTSDT